MTDTFDEAIRTLEIEYEAVQQLFEVYKEAYDEELDRRLRAERTIEELKAAAIVTVHPWKENE